MLTRMRLDLPPPLPSTLPQEGACHCQQFLDPFPTPGSFAWRYSLQHYCRVCNTQLNSCKQTRIHVDGKKHEKRLSHLKYSLESSDLPPTVYQPTSQYGSNTMSGVPHQAGQPMLQPAVPSLYSYPPPCPLYQSPTYYYPGQTTGGASHPTSLPPLINYPSPTSYTDYAPPPVTSAVSVAAQRVGVPPHNPTTPSKHGVMSPSLTSGFSGSGDCKSTETCSLVSVASYNSVNPNHFRQQSAESSESQTEHIPPSRAPPPRGVASCRGISQPMALRPVNQMRVPVKRLRVKCEICNVVFPSRSVLEHHLIGTRHNKKVKAFTVFRKLQENGVEFRAHLPTGDIRCEVCEVSVNSSHQLQAHMSGHKHKVRCARQGVKSTQAILTPFSRLLTPASSTAPSSTPSEASAPVRSYSVLVGRPKFGSRPNLYQSGRTSRSFSKLSSTKLSSPKLSSSNKLSSTKLSSSKFSSTKLSSSKLSSTKLSSSKLSASGKLHKSRLSSSNGAPKLSSKVSKSGRFLANGKLSSASSTSSAKNAGNLSKFKSRKTVRQARHKSQESLQESTTESDESGVQKLSERSDRPTAASSSSCSGQQTEVNSSSQQQPEESDEAKESEDDGTSRGPKDEQVTAAAVAVHNSEPEEASQEGGQQHAKASQTEPIRQLSDSESQRVGAAAGEMAMCHSETRRAASGSSLETVSRKYGSSYSLDIQQDGERRRSKSSGEHLTYWCNLCQISLNSKSQMSQHESSSRHRQRQKESNGGHSSRGNNSYGGAAQLRGNNPPGNSNNNFQLQQQQQQGGLQGCQFTCNHAFPSLDPAFSKGERAARDIPMLNMFLQRLQQHTYFPPIRDEEEAGESGR